MHVIVHVCLEFMSFNLHVYMCSRSKNVFKSFLWACADVRRCMYIFIHIHFICNMGTCVCMSACVMCKRTYIIEREICQCSMQTGVTSGKGKLLTVVSVGPQIDINA